MDGCNALVIFAATVIVFLVDGIEKILHRKYR